MLDNLFASIITTTASGSLSPLSFLLCTLGALVLGLLAALIHMYKNTYTKSFLFTLAMLPAIVQIVIMMVNGNIGAGVAVAGTFSLVRFRSYQGSAREIGSLFLAMALGLAAGMGYLGVAFVFVIVYGGVSLIYTSAGFGKTKRLDQDLKITIPETLDYTGVFDDLFAQYTTESELYRVRTVNLGSLYLLQYRVRLRDPDKQKEFLDEIRCRNGNLDIVLGRASEDRSELL